MDNFLKNKHLVSRAGFGIHYHDLENYKTADPKKVYNFLKNTSDYSALKTDIQPLSPEEYQGKLNGHLKNGDFFEVEKYPTATYKITSVKKNASKDYNFVVNGNLTVKGKTNPVSFPAKITAKNGVVTLESDKFSFDRQKFDVAYKSTMQDVLVKDDVDLKVKISVK